MQTEPPSPSAAPLPTLQGAGRRFRPSPLRLLAYPFTWVPPLAIFALFTAVTALLGRPAPRFALEMAARTLVISGITSLSLALFPFWVGPDGIRGFNFWGVPLLMRWDEVREARRANLLGFPYLRVLSDRGATALWLPLALPDLQPLADAVREYGGPNTPVARWLESQGR